jgi:hypothetical protein
VAAGKGEESESLKRKKIEKKKSTPLPPRHPTHACSPDLSFVPLCFLFFFEFQFCFSLFVCLCNPHFDFDPHTQTTGGAIQTAIAHGEYPK